MNALHICPPHLSDVATLPIIEKNKKVDVQSVYVQNWSSINRPIFAAANQVATLTPNVTSERAG